MSSHGCAVPRSLVDSQYHHLRVLFSRRLVYREGLQCMSPGQTESPERGIRSRNNFLNGLCFVSVKDFPSKFEGSRVISLEHARQCRQPSILYAQKLMNQSQISAEDCVLPSSPGFSQCHHCRLLFRHIELLCRHEREKVLAYMVIGRSNDVLHCRNVDESKQV
jgi:hypothetical protein